MNKTHPGSLKKKIVGYAGSTVGACDFFRWQEDEYVPEITLDCNYLIHPIRAFPKWRKVTLTIEIQAEIKRLEKMK